MKKGLVRIRELIERKRDLISSVLDARIAYALDAEEIKGKGGSKEDKETALKTMKTEILRAISEKLGEIEDLNVEIAEKITKGIKYILGIGLIFAGRNGDKTDTEEYYSGYIHLMQRLNDYLMHMVKVVDKKGKPLGYALQMDAEAMHLEYVDPARDRITSQAPRPAAYSPRRG